MKSKRTPFRDCLFIGVTSTGISYADRCKEEHGDYKKVGFLRFDTLEFKAYGGDVRLVHEAARHAESVIRKRGQEYEVSASGQRVVLGHKLRNGHEVNARKRLAARLKR